MDSPLVVPVRPWRRLWRAIPGRGLVGAGLPFGGCRGHLCRVLLPPKVAERERIARAAFQAERRQYAPLAVARGQIRGQVNVVAAEPSGLAILEVRAEQPRTLDKLALRRG